MKHAEQDTLTQQIKSVLDQSVEDIDADTRYRLQIARAKVLQSNEVASDWYQRKSIWVSVASFACISVLAIFLFMGSPEYPLNNVDIVSNVDSLLFETDAGIELYEQYDFYVWLSSQGVNS
jgi:hypothetical protein|tara:strand:+ start:2460 stop:2822 length:363 start_codon:yes stop_codon:yes gene_type:complete